MKFNSYGTYRVQNLKEGSRPAPHGYSSWIEYWGKATGLKADKCKDATCYEDAEDGAHVMLADSDDNSWYIVPLCHYCNCQFGRPLIVKGPLVSVTDPKKILW